MSTQYNVMMIAYRNFINKCCTSNKRLINVVALLTVLFSIEL